MPLNLQHLAFSGSYHTGSYWTVLVVAAYENIANYSRILYSLQKFTVLRLDGFHSSLLSSVQQAPPDPVRLHRRQAEVAL